MDREIYSVNLTSIIKNITFKGWDTDNFFLSKKERYVLAAMHYIFWIDFVGEAYGYRMTYSDKFFSLLNNDLKVYSKCGLTPKFAGKVELPIRKICHSSDKPNWVEEIKKRTKTTALPLYCKDGYEKSNYKDYDEYGKSLRVPGWAQANTFVQLLSSWEFIQSAKQGLSDIVKETEANIVKETEAKLSAR